MCLCLTVFSWMYPPPPPLFFLSLSLTISSLPPSLRISGYFPRYTFIPLFSVSSYICVLNCLLIFLSALSSHLPFSPASLSLDLSIYLYLSIIFFFVSKLLNLLLGETQYCHPHYYCNRLITILRLKKKISIKHSMGSKVTHFLHGSSFNESLSLHVIMPLQRQSINFVCKIQSSFS